ncbi:PREDICTED: FIP1[III]-like protein [Nicotiana attenuata]|uniref:Fip1[iii]-like protein n=1 Tax=Nicotiana attenuata TaxID=49451 RepID=A0A314KUE4_NICAT|nr:PREDICTED: FIP1[III]-like protein [Nicotiana attenuata]OIT32988.1 fip1[iii]-like protein [Nicotiana attenuata]
MENVVDDDDDFGDLYADVEVQASSAIYTVQNSTQLQTKVNDVDCNAGGNFNGENGVGEVEEECQSESEDDLNIVLNYDEEDYDNHFLNEDGIEENGGNAEGNGSGQKSNNSENGNAEKNSYKNTRPPQAAYSSHLKANGSSCLHSYSTALVKGTWEDNGYMQRMGSGPAAQNGQSFSLPRSRNILDMNIDMFEKKPWRYPGADLTDYFNFGFDEDSWKQYCNCLDKHREKAKRVVKDSDYKTSKNSKPKGREIEVEESIIERQPSTDVERSQDRDSNVVIQIALQDSVEDPINSPKEQRESSENGDVGRDGRDFLCFSSASEDELASLEGRGVSGNSTSRRNTPVREHVSMDSDNNGNCEFSDADEHHRQEGTECDVNQTSGAIESSHDANKSSVRDISDPRKSVMLQEPLHGEGRQHSPGSSCCSLSHSDASEDGAFLDIEKSHDHHIRSLPNADSELPAKGTIDYQPVSGTHYIQTKSGGSKYFTRGRKPVQRDLLHDRRRPGRMSETIPTHLKVEDSRKSDARILYERRNSTVIQHRHRDRQYAFDSHEREDTSHFKRAEPFYCNAGRFSDYPCRDSYKKDPEREYQLEYRYDNNWCSSRSTKRKLNPLELSLSTYDELSERDRPHYGSGLTVQDMDNISFHESEQWIDKHIPYQDDEIPSQQMWKIDQLQSNNRMRTDDLVTGCNYIYDIMEETDYRYRSYNNRDTNIIEDGYHVNLTYFRRETKSPNRGKRRDNSPHDSLNNVFCMDLKDEEGRFHGYRPPSFRLYREPCTASRRWQSPELPRGRHGIFSGTRKCQDGGQSANLTNSISADQTIMYPGNQGNFKRGRRYRQSEGGLHRVEDENIRYQQNILEAERTSCSFRRNLNDKRFESFDNKHGPDLVEKLLDDRHVDHEKYKLIREGNKASQFGQGSKFFHRDNRWRFPKGRDSVATGLVVENRESSGRCSKAGGVTLFGRRTLRSRNLTTDPKENDKERLDIFSDAQQEEYLDLEEGEIISEVMNEKTIKRRSTCFGKSQVSEMKNFANDKDVEGKDNPKILEIMAKMEKRGERFKQPIALKSDSKNLSKPSVDLFTGTTEAMQPRPARKRRWVASEAN